MVIEDRLTVLRSEISVIDIKFAYEYFHLKWNKQEYILNSRDSKIIESFLILLKTDPKFKSLRKNFLFQYFSFQFDYWKDKDIQQQKEISWIIGKKAYQRFKETEFTEQYLFQIEASNSKRKISIFEYKGDYKTNSQSEDIERKKYTGIKQFYNCVENTTLYSFISPICNSSCEYKEKCMTLLNNNYPNLFSYRANNK